MTDYVFPSTADLAKSDAYIQSILDPHGDPALEAATQNRQANGLPEISAGLQFGKFLKLTAQAVNAKRILEIGTLGGYTAIWLARALPEGGKLITLEISDKHAKVARENIDRASLSSKVEVKVGPAINTLKTLNPDEPFDLVFIDADWESVRVYFNEAKRLARKGAAIVIDNVNYDAKVALEPEDTKEAYIRSIKGLLDQLKEDKEVDVTILGIAEYRRFDGLLYAIKQ
ncbi:O-methyltransferase [Fomitiporia mediterranea MF3/22]|uniref:O-methyltransferase n=1 Tax=Fomitiporia mediterranea (strain MF3/22) TaxID=694068 RepID=R7SH17_FOMME|nr:O-methyltransferase [Fomitiporia mediterranea MF3/22]EJC97700.1 O-methyltransferase [Fomitiporia mediterranea MF3/22]